MYGARDSWVRNVEIRNADIGVAWIGMSFSTMQNVRLTADKIRYQPCCNNTGHHGIWIILSSDNVISDFKVDAQYVHDVALENSSINNVITRGGGYNLNVDFHRYMPWGNLITEVRHRPLPAAHPAPPATCCCPALGSGKGASCAHPV